MNKVYFVIPCYNEEDVLPETAKRLAEKTGRLIAQGRIARDSRIVFVDDGSRDRTWALIEELHQNNPLFSGVKLSRNRGHQNALLAGLMTVREQCDCVISFDADLQDDIEVFDAFLDKYEAGCDIVYGVRGRRATDTFFKRFTAQTFYKLMKGLGVDVIYNHADYRLMSRRALEGLAQYKEVNLFLRGVVPLIGYKSATVIYDRNARFAGESKYPFKKMLSFALDGVTSFSVKPLRMICALGFIMAFISLIGILYALVSKLTGSAVTGWTAIIASIFFIGGIQIFCIGVVGEYIGKIYNETKARPRFIVEQYLNEELVG